MVSDILIYCLKTILTIGNMSQSRLTKDWSMMITKWESCVNTGHWCNLALRPCCMVASSIWCVFLPPSPHPGHAFLCLVSHPLCNCLGKMSCLDTLSKDSGCDNNSAWMINPYSRVFSNTTVVKHWFFGAKPSLWSNSHIHGVAKSRTWLSNLHSLPHAHPYMTTGKSITLTIQNFVGKVMTLLFNMLPRFIIAFLLRS